MISKIQGMKENMFCEIDLTNNVLVFGPGFYTLRDSKCVFPLHLQAMHSTSASLIPEGGNMISEVVSDLMKEAILKEVVGVSLYYTVDSSNSFTLGEWCLQRWQMCLSDVLLFDYLKLYLLYPLKTARRVYSCRS